jgi:hypothetical protein
MTTKQADKLIGREITVSWPKQGCQDTIVITLRRNRSAIVEAKVKRLGGRIGVFDCHEFERVLDV